MRASEVTPEMASGKYITSTGDKVYLWLGPFPNGEFIWYIKDSSFRPGFFYPEEEVSFYE